jgi:hypothetical protein
MSGETQERGSDWQNSVLLTIEEKETTVCEHSHVLPYLHNYDNIIHASNIEGSEKIAQALLKEPQTASGKFAPHKCGSAKQRLKSLCDEHYRASNTYSLSTPKSEPRHEHERLPLHLAPGIYNMYILNGIVYFGLPP